MDATVAQIIEIMDRLVPPWLAEEWDNVGLQIGNPRLPARRIWVALDPGPEVIEAACQHKVDLLITHHPLIFRPLKSIDFDTPGGSIIQKAAQHQLAIFSAHTILILSRMASMTSWHNGWGSNSWNCCIRSKLRLLFKMK